MSDYTDGNWEHCAIGAISLVTENHNEYMQAQNAVMEYLRTEKNLHFSNVPAWNDANGRTAEEVRECMLMTAKRLRNGEGK